EEDVPAILRIYNYSIETSAATFDLEPQTLEYRLEWFSHYGDHYPLIVAEWEGITVGYSSLSQFRTKPAYDPTVELSVYIDEAYQGKGIGNRLVEEMLARGKALGFHSVISGITAGNEVSVKMHDKFGFRLIGSFKEVGMKFGKWHDVLFYQLFFDELQKP
ncbi:MAG: GNAT family N-acetyltransferase, partial [Gorillibacterium sp.]|nr:GNAT family N-acetyltransferase [Gorillibacterium sp.]